MYDLGLTEDEFLSLTPALFKALRKRREVEFRYACFANAIVAADYRNSHRYSSSERVFSPMDYIAGEDEQDPRREEAKRNIMAIYSMFGAMTPEQAEKQKAKVIAGLKQQRFADAEQIFAEVFE